MVNYAYFGREVRETKSGKIDKKFFRQSISFPLKGHMILYHKSNLVYTVIFPQFLIFQKNNSAETSVLIFFTSLGTIIFLKN